MAIRTTVEVVCDYPGCGNLVSWCQEDCEKNPDLMPKEAKFLVILTYQQKNHQFCGQFHASSFFTPPGYEVKKKGKEKKPRLVPVDKVQPIKWTVGMFPPGGFPPESPENGQDDNRAS